MKTCIIFCLTSFSFILTAQISSCDYLEKAIGHFQNKELDSAIVLMTSAIKETPDTTTCYGRCFNNIPIAYAMMEDYDNAIIWFKKILTSDLDDLEQGTDIMEPYANYRHNACMKLVQVHEILEEQQRALAYLTLAETKYPFETFSGTSYEKRAVSIAKWKARIYESCGTADSSLFIQLNKILDTDIRYRKSDFTSLSVVNFYDNLIKNVSDIIGEQKLESEKKKLKKSIQKLKLVPSGLMRQGIFVYRGLEYKIGVSDADKNRDEIILNLLENEFFN
ncbi:MAG: hypothetical protein COA38_13185 [Fluviicola sp.]|nr:MAG: hypothetical protein COA38_13185 [Fluviicola sp.]